MFENDVPNFAQFRKDFCFSFFFQKKEKQHFHSLEKPVLSVSHFIPLLCLLIKVMQTPCESKVHETLNSQSVGNYSL